jgi:hypothetical protein
MDPIEKFNDKFTKMLDELEKDIFKGEGKKRDEILAKATVDNFNRFLALGRKLYLEEGDKKLLVGIRDTEPKSLKFNVGEYYNLLTGQFNPNLINEFLIKSNTELVSVGKKFRRGLLTGVKGKDTLIKMYYTLDYYYYQPVSDVVKIKHLVDFQSRVLTFEDKFDSKTKTYLSDYDSVQARSVKSKMILKVKNGEENAYSYFYKVKNIMERMMRQIYT